MTGPDIPASRIAAVLKAFSNVVGSDNVFQSEVDQAAYSDPFAPKEGLHVPSAGVAPETVEEIQAIVQLANEHKVPLWPISRGKNFGYGGPAPVVANSVVLDLSRMKKIEVDVENGTVLVEPGVSFFDLYDYIQERNIPLWLSVPGNSWGSVAGNALDRGVGYTTYGDHAARICGLEVVLPDGDLVRTGMGAMKDASTWQLYKPGFGPSWDTMFCQSNFGIVTKLGLWLMPAPESMLGYDIACDRPEDLEWLVDTLVPLRREGVIQQSPSIGNWLRSVAVMTQREHWVDEGKPITDDVIARIRKEYNLGWWNVSIRFYGRLDITEATSKVVKTAFDRKPVLDMKPTRWVQGDPPEGSPTTGVPVTFPLANANWWGGRGGHIGFSPVMPPRGDLAMKAFKENYALYQDYGFDYHPSFALGERHMTNVNQVLFDRDDPEMMKKVNKLFEYLVKRAHEQGYGEYRTHIEYMDLVADTYDFNDNALRRLNERVKTALDPNGIVAPGKSGIWSVAQKGGQ